MAARKGKAKGEKKHKKGASKGAKRAASLSSAARSVPSGASFKKRSAASRKGWETRRALQKKRSEAARKGWVTRRERKKRQLEREEQFLDRAEVAREQLVLDIRGSTGYPTTSQKIRARMIKHASSIKDLDSEIQTMSEEGLGSIRELYTLFYSPDAA